MLSAKLLVDYIIFCGISQKAISSKELSDNNLTHQFIASLAFIKFDGNFMEYGGMNENCFRILYYASINMTYEKCIYNYNSLFLVLLEVYLSAQFFTEVRMR